MTKYYDWKNEIKKNELQECEQIIKKDGIIVFPTETIYGLGANALSQKAVARIYEAKGRESDNPLIVHISNKSMISQLTYHVTEIEQKLIDAFMPGPFTLVLKKKEQIPDNVTAGMDTVGIRMPSNKIANQLIEASGVPIAAPSANISGRPSGTNINDIKTELEGKVDAIIDGGFSDIGVESTVVKVIEGVPTILRPGKITPEDIRAVCGLVALNKKIFEKVEKGEKVESPGMKYRHYAPSTKCVLVCNEVEEKQIQKVNELLRENEKIGVVGFTEHKDKIDTPYFIEMGSKNNLDEISKNIFRILRQVDTMGCKMVIIEGVKQEGLGLAIMNRLIRACEYNIYEN